eukprot:TRINITY_DN15661_c0_g1_i8.p1 TRINITY_DN15661_c0_g1~~TRINITY_DN15661_c0_g1_i8.p1  ORF type:complete len:247 (+),score=50.96 TRINITY_DN15661_c0_g1_i8:78-818(+)
MSSESDAEAQDALVYDGRSGFPLMTKEKKDKGASSASVMMPVFYVVPRAIGLALAYFAIYAPNKDVYDNRMNLISKAVGADGGSLGYLYFAAGVFQALVHFTNNFPMIQKSKVMPGNAGNLRANMQVYKMLNPLGTAPSPYVVLEEEGDVGLYNRANRALYHFTENATAICMLTVLGGLVFHKAIFVLIVLFAVARIWYSIAYTYGGYGLGICKHAFGFALAHVLILPTIEMLVWLTGFMMVKNKY